ncbi:MAG: regulatory protein MarR [Microbacterium sp.]|jgi:DNA-binding MarR family transcriptional regulator|nr:regulatory protein MarR [Microbacterium sp.]
MEELTKAERVALNRLHALLELLPTTLDKELATSGLTLFEYTLLATLAESDHQRLRLSALAARTNATLPRLSRVVTGLERKLLVIRMPCDEDGRATNAVLTQAGAQVVDDARPLYTRAVRANVLGALGDDGVDELSRIALGVLSRLDPQGTFTVTSDARVCAADPSMT